MGLFSTNKKEGANSRKLFGEACAQAEANAQWLLRRADLYPIYISPGFEHVFGVEPQRLIDDVDTLQRFMPEGDRVRIRRLVREWDGESTLSCEFDYLAPGADAAAATGAAADPASTGPASTASPAGEAGSAAAQAARRHFRCTTAPTHGGAYLLVSMTDYSSRRGAGGRQPQDERGADLLHLFGQQHAPANVRSVLRARRRFRGMG